MPQLPFKSKDIERIKARLIGIVNSGFNLAANYVWEGLHTFTAKITTHDIEPAASDTYDIGSPEKRYKTIRTGELAATLFSKEQVMILGNTLLVTKNQGTFPSAVDAGDGSIDFGQAMTLNDFVLIQAEDAVTGNPSTEYIQITSLVSGTTYNVTRNVDSSGTNDWASGTPYAVLGQNGDYRIEISAGAVPSIKLIKQGVDWDDATEDVVVNEDGIIQDAGSFYKIFSPIIGVGELGEIFQISSSVAGDGSTVETTVNTANTLGDATHNIEVESPTADQANLREVVNGGAAEMTIRAATNGLSQYPGFASSSLIGAERSLRKFTSPAIGYLPGFHFDPLGAWLSYPGLRAIWNGYGYDGTGSTAIIPDKSGMAHHLTAQNGLALSKYENPTLDYPSIAVMDFDGSNDYADRANETVFNAGNNLDIQVAVRLDTLPASTAAYGIIVNGVTTANWRLFAYNNGTKSYFVFQVYNSGGTVFEVNTSADPSIAANKWYVIRLQLVLSSILKMTVNGTTYSVTAPTTLRAASGNFQIGRLTTSSYLDGKIYAVALAVNDNSDDLAHYALWNSMRDYLDV